MEKTPVITSIRYSYGTERKKPMKGDMKYFKGAGRKKGWYIRDFERVSWGPHKGAMVVTRNGPRYEWVKMDPQPPIPE